MKDKWLKDIHDRMANYEINEPDGLWEDIQAGLPRPNDTHRDRKTAVWLWIKRTCATAAAAAAIIAMITVGLHTETDTDTLNADNTTLIATVNDNHADDIPPVVAPPRQQSAEAVSTDKVTPKRSEVIESQTVTETTTTTETTEAPVTANQTDTQTQPPATERKKQEYTYPAGGGNTYYAVSDRPQKGGSRHVSVGMFSSGGMSASLYGKSSATPVASIGADGKTWNDNPMLGILLFNQGAEIETQIKHKLPVRFGLTFAYGLNSRLSIESGLTYTILMSDIKEGSKNNYYTGNQTLHYIGIPLTVRYKVFSWKKLDLYASAGVLTEKRVAGKIDKNYVLQNNTEKTEKETIASHPFQFSANIGAGIQYSLTRKVGLYVEPGMSYYFDDNSPVETIYKEKPLNFNLNLGLRLTFGK